MRASLADVHVRDIMTQDPTTFASKTTVADLLDNQLHRHRFSSYPLVGPAGQLEGLTTMNRIRHVPAKLRETTRLIDTGIPFSEVPAGAPGEPIPDLLQRMQASPDGRAFVLDAPAVWWASCHPATSPGSCKSPCCGPSGVRPRGTDPIGSVSEGDASLPSPRVVPTPRRPRPNGHRGRTRIQLTWHRRLVTQGTTRIGGARTTAHNSRAGVKDLVVAEHDGYGSGRRRW